MKLFNKNFGGFEATLILGLLAVYYYFTFKIHTDILSHAMFIINYINGQDSFPSNFLYYGTIYFISFCSSNINILLSVSVFILTIFTFLKYFIVKRIMSVELKANKNINSHIPALCSVISCLLLFSFSLPTILVFQNFYYLGSFPPNVWHNSTTIFSMPFVVLLFWLSGKQLVSFDLKRLLLISVMIALNVFSKPSFLFVYLIAYPIMLVIRYSFSKQFWINLLPIAIAALLILLEFVLIFITKNSADKSNSITICFFQFIHAWFAHGNMLYAIGVILSCFISSYFFPIVLFIRHKGLLKDKIVQFAIICNVIALIISQTFAETGSRAAHGNFIWQVIMCSFLLFFICVLQLLKIINNNSMNWKPFRLDISVFILHFFSGVLYFIKIIITNNYF